MRRGGAGGVSNAHSPCGAALDPRRGSYRVMNDAWFEEYLYQAVVHKKYLTAAQAAAWEAEPVVPEPWDPMGSLAR